METNEIKINVPNGYEIDEENSTFECIKFKKKSNIPWRYRGEYIDGFSIMNDQYNDCEINHVIATSPYGIGDRKHLEVYAEKSQAKSAFAMAQISQIMKHDERFGGVVTDEEWQDRSVAKHVLTRYKGSVDITNFGLMYFFLAFHTRVQAELFLKENRDLVEDYLMIER